MSRKASLFDDGRKKIDMSKTSESEESKEIGGFEGCIAAQSLLPAIQLSIVLEHVF